MADPRFHTTRWSQVLAARTPSDPASVDALSSLCQDYWFPVYAFIRRRGYDADDAADLTQGYFAELLEKGHLEAADPARGRFRSFVLATVKQYLSHEREKRRALKRGGGHELVALEVGGAEERLLVDRVAGHSPERAFERSWALTVLDRAKRSLAGEFEAEGKQEQYRVLSRYLTGDRSEPSYKEAARELGTTDSAIKMAVRRMRQRFGRVLRDEVAGTTGESGDVAAEVAHLVSVLSQP